MTMLRPAYRLTIGDRIVDSSDEPKASTIIELEVRLDMAIAADGFVLIQGQVGGFSPAPEDEAAISLGYLGEDLEPVLTGRVVDVVPGFETKRIVGLSTADRLLRHHENQTYEAMTAGEMVEALADAAGVSVARIDDGVDLPAFVVDGRRSVAAHIGDLAALSGYDSYVNADGELIFEEFAGNRTAHELRYGEHAIDVTRRNTRVPNPTVEVWGESPGAARGTESWAWLTKDFEPYRGASGTGSPRLLLERSAIRTGQAAAAAAARTHTNVSRRAITGTLRIQGRPQVRLGELVHLVEFPSDDLDGNYQVRSVTHRITKAGGFTTDVGFGSIEAAPGSLPAGVGGVGP